jgi:predicted RNase H-like HicB family nuclease
MNTKEFIFKGVICREGEFYSALCIELDVASDGLTSDEAAAHLLEAVALYMETAFEANLPYMRPVPAIDDPRMTCPEAIVKVFDFKVDFQIKAYA